MLSGDDMTRYLLFPDVSFRGVEKWRKQDHVGVQTVPRYGHRVFSSFESFPRFFLCFFVLLCFFVFLLFVLVGFVFETVIGGRGI